MWWSDGKSFGHEFRTESDRGQNQTKDTEDVLWKVLKSSDKFRISKKWECLLLGKSDSCWLAPAVLMALPPLLLPRCWSQRLHCARPVKPTQATPVPAPPSETLAWPKLQKTPKKSRTYCIILHPGVEDCTWLRLSMIYKYPQDGLHNVSTCWIQNVLKAVLQKKHPKSSTNILHVPHGPPSPWSNRARCSSLALHSQGTASPPATEMAGEVSMLQISACFVWPK